MMYGTRSAAGVRPAAKVPRVIAGLKCPPLMWPTAYAMVTTVKPKASDTPTRPMPHLGKPGGQHGTAAAPEDQPEGA